MVMIIFLMIIVKFWWLILGVGIGICALIGTHEGRAMRAEREEYEAINNGTYKRN